MQTIDELGADIKLNPEQLAVVKQYVSLLVLELLDSLKQDNVKNFDETIENFKSLT